MLFLLHVMLQKTNAVQTYVENHGFSLLREYEGHGIGEQMHEDPGVPNIGRKGTGPRLQAGMAIAIEPMVCEGKPDVYVKRDMWTVATRDRKMTAYYENTIVIYENSWYNKMYQEFLLYPFFVFFYIYFFCKICYNTVYNAYCKN